MEKLSNQDLSLNLGGCRQFEPSQMTSCPGIITLGHHPLTATPAEEERTRHVYRVATERNTPAERPERWTQQRSTAAGTRRRRGRWRGLSFGCGRRHQAGGPARLRPPAPRWPRPPERRPQNPVPAPAAPGVAPLAPGPSARSPPLRRRQARIALPEAFARRRPDHIPLCQEDWNIM